MIYAVEMGSGGMIYVPSLYVSQRRTSQISSISNINIAASQISETKPYGLNACTNLHETWYVYIMPSETVSMEYIINPSHQ
jgi:hypothetical protein